MKTYEFAEMIELIRIQRDMIEYLKETSEIKSFVIDDKFYLISDVLKKYNEILNSDIIELANNKHLMNYINNVEDIRSKIPIYN